MRRLEEEIERLKAAHSYRTLKPASGIDFTSNDYLGFARHPAIREAAITAIDAEGIVGASGSRLLRGHHPLHEQLERRAADFFACEATLYFSSGYLANLALFTTLCDRHDAIIYDEAIHASAKEGIHAAPADRYRAVHNDLNSFDDNLSRARARTKGALWIAVESVYSMEGDIAPLDALITLAEAHDAKLIVDEAHATGIFGRNGRGVSEGRPASRLIAVHTCGKALGVAGALICASSVIVDYLINRARPFIYSTAPPPLLAAALMRALDLVDEEQWRRERLLKIIEFASERLARSAGDHLRFGGSQIMPVILGAEERALSAGDSLQRAGFDVRAIRPPTVPAGTSRLRLSINCGHSEDDIAQLAEALESALA
jgi:8-amino-7-oxononanoate synthase